MVGEIVPFIETVAKAEILDNLVGKSTPVEIAKTYRRPHLVVEEQVGKIFLCKLRHMKQGVPLVVALNLLLAKLLFLDLNIIFVGQPAKGLGIGVVLMFHEETDNIAAFAASKAFVQAF